MLKKSKDTLHSLCCFALWSNIEIKYNKQGFIQPLLQTAFFTEDWVTSRGFCGGRWWKYYVFISCIFEIFKFLAICWYKINTDESNFSTIDTITFYLNFQELSLKLNQKMELWLQWNGSHLLAAWTPEQDAFGISKRMNQRIYWSLSIDKGVSLALCMSRKHHFLSS